MKRLFLIITLIVSQSAGAAQTAYVTDQFEILFRNGAGDEYKILKTIKSGDAVTVLKLDSTTRYARVRLNDGTIGWVLSQFLLKEPVARTRLEKIQQSLSQLKTENAQYKAQLEALHNQQRKSKGDNENLSSKAQQLSREIAEIRKTAANALKIQAERDYYLNENKRLENEKNKLEQENNILENSDSQDWFLIGAGVLFAGIALGFIIPSFSARRSSGWDSL